MAQRTGEAAPTIGQAQAIDKPMSKAKARNSRSGCGECKTRRLKCDELRPACKQCIRRGRICSGYQRQYRWSTVHEKVRPVDRTPSSFWPQNEHAALLNTLTHHPSTANWSIGSSAYGQNSVVPVPSNAALPSVPPNRQASVTLPTDIKAIDDQYGHQLDRDSTAANWNANATLTPEQSGTGAPYICPERGERLDTSSSVGSAALDLFTSLTASSSWHSEDDYQNKPEGQLPLSILPAAATPPLLLYTPIHLPTMLIEYWFSDVCVMWSAFDSQTNPNRLLAANGWQHSDAVFYALQSMSAACLAESLPQVAQSIPVLFSQAVEAIQRGSQARKPPGNATPRALPKDLLLAIMAMGTSVCWTDTRQLGLWFLGKAHELLDHVEDAAELNDSERGELSYFRAALVYWEMLYRAIGWDPQNTLKNKRAMFKGRLQKAMSWSDDPPSTAEDGALQQNLQPASLQKLSHDATIHPWTGVSAEVQHTFGLVILLCRDRRMADRKQGARTAALLSDALCDIELARSFARDLLDANFYQQAQDCTAFALSYDTGDSTTPVSHLIDTAEAYRLASLLLLCQTFPDLEVDGVLDSCLAVPMSDNMACGSDGSSSQRHALLLLTMRLVETLRRIPAKSGTRCIQPLLYICAGSGLRFDTTQGMDTLPSMHHGHGRSDRPAISEPSSAAANAARLGVAYISSPGRLNEAARIAAESTNLTTCTLEVSRARRFVVDRLYALQRTLPPKPIGVALDLVKAVWAEYDVHDHESIPLHWIDIMVDKGLQTLFG